MEVTTFVIAILGFTISAILAAVKVWETFLSQSAFETHFEWIDRPGLPRNFDLRFTLTNSGHRTDSIREVAVVADGTEYKRDEIRDLLPARLEPAEISDAFTMNIEHERGDQPQAGVQAGQAELLIRTALGKEHRFPIPALTEPWSGRVSVREHHARPADRG